MHVLLENQKEGEEPRVLRTTSVGVVTTSKTRAPDAEIIEDEDEGEDEVETESTTNAAGVDDDAEVHPPGTAACGTSTTDKSAIYDRLATVPAHRSPARRRRLYIVYFTVSSPVRVRYDLGARLRARHEHARSATSGANRC